jgi:formate hydrogenlyase subunit 3/multisubunit Na+/H+ antiporter MnhD subunit
MARRGTHEWVTVVLLPLVWVVGVVLLWRSRAWSRRDKLLGTLVIPGGLAVVEYALIEAVLALREDCGEGCSVGIYIDPLSAVILLALTITPLITALYLAARANLNRLG